MGHATRERLYRAGLVISVAVELLCLVAVVVGWHNAEIQVLAPYWRRGDPTAREVSLCTASGLVGLHYHYGSKILGATGLPPPTITAHQAIYGRYPDLNYSAWGSIGFGWKRASWYVASGPLVDQSIAFPLWPLVFLSAPLPLHWWDAKRRRRRLTRAHLCVVCGYDLRGSPPDGDCPECGQVRSKPH